MMGGRRVAAPASTRADGSATVGADDAPADGPPGPGADVSPVCDDDSGLTSLSLTDRPSPIAERKAASSQESTNHAKRNSTLPGCSTPSGSAGHFSRGPARRPPCGQQG